MRDGEDRLFPHPTESLEKENPRDIQMIRRLIEDEEIDLRDEKSGNLYLRLLSS